MTRFEEVQMKIAESAKSFLEVYNIQVFIEQFSLTRESRFSLTLPGMEEPYPVSAVVSLTYDVFQTSMSMYDDLKPEEDNISSENTLELDVIVRLPIMEGYPDIEGLLREIAGAKSWWCRNDNHGSAPHRQGRQERSRWQRKDLTAPESG